MAFYKGLFYLNLGLEVILIEKIKDKTSGFEFFSD